MRYRIGSGASVELIEGTRITKNKQYYGFSFNTFRRASICVGVCELPVGFSHQIYICSESLGSSV